MTSRPKRNRPSYTEIFQPIFSDEEKIATDIVGDSDSEAGSVFDPTVVVVGGYAAESPSDDELDDVLDEEKNGKDNEEEDSESVISMGNGPVLREGFKSRKQGTKSAAAVNASTSTPGIQNLLSVSRPHRSGVSVAPNLPSKDHRHRPHGLWAPPSDVYRLLSPPVPFAKSEVIRTNSADHPAVMQRVKKAWANSSGTGPVWELLEDRAFFKEEWTDYDLSSRKGRKLRPVVFPTVRAQQPQILSREDASRYLPHDNHDVSIIKVSVGPAESQSTHHLGLFDSLILEQTEQDAYAHLLFAGGPVSTLDWCPTSPKELDSRKGAQYLALAPLPSLDHRTTFHGSPPLPSCIQLWSISPTVDPDRGDEPRGMKVSCQLVACIDDGPVKVLKWAPLPSHDDTPRKGIRKVGVLGTIAESGDLCLYVIPHPHDLRPDSKEVGRELVFCNFSPAVRLRLPGTHCTCFDWANGESIAVGCSNGFVAIYHITSTALTGADINPSHYFPVHQNSVRSLSWIRVPPCDSSGQFRIDEDPVIIFTAGVEGIAKVTDIRDLSPRIVVRNREIPYSTSFSSMTGCIIASDIDYWVKVWQVASAFLGRGHNLLDTGGSALTISCSDLHPYAAIGSADGSCITANQLRSTRREASVPLFNHKVFQLEYSEKTGTYRMLDHFLPFETGAGDGKVASGGQARASNNQKEKNQTRYNAGLFDGSALWPHEVSVLSMCWNSSNGLENAPWLASGTVSGLVRIDWLQGRWFRDAIPYTGTPSIRFEGQPLEGHASDSE